MNEIFKIILQGMITIIAAIIPIILIQKKAREIRYLPTKDNLNQIWLKDMNQGNKLSFIGISHSKLKHYLEDMCKITKINEKLIEIEIYFNDNIIGVTHEGLEYQNNINTNMIEIAFFLSQSIWKNRYPNFKRIVFKKIDGLSTVFGGTYIFKNDNNNMVNEVNIIYVIQNQFIGDYRDESLTTFRYYNGRMGSKKQRNLIKIYMDSYNMIKNHANKLVELKTNNWDNSFDKWEKYIHDCQAYQNSINDFIDYMKLSESDRLIDLGCGTGILSEKIIKVFNKIELALVDNSPGMIHKAKINIGNRCKYYLLNIQDDITLYGLYNKIAIHRAIEALDNEIYLGKVANWCYNNLSIGGCVYISITNTKIHITNDTYKKEADIFRETMKRIVKNNYKNAKFIENVDKITIEEIDKTFLEKGFIVNNDISNEKKYSLRITDRIALWSTPAIFYTFVDKDSVKDIDIKNVMSEVEDEITNQNTPDLIMKFLSYKKI
jgi:SAM-dependent methyltransferase